VSSEGHGRDRDHRLDHDRLSRGCVPLRVIDGQGREILAAEHVLQGQANLGSGHLGQLGAGHLQAHGVGEQVCNREGGPDFLPGQQRRLTQTNVRPNHARRVFRTALHAFLRLERHGQTAKQNQHGRGGPARQEQSMHHPSRLGYTDPWSRGQIGITQLR